MESEESQQPIETEGSQKRSIKLHTGLNLFSDAIGSASDIVVELNNNENQYGSFFNHINRNKGKTIVIPSRAATAYSLIKDTLKYPHFSGIATYLETVAGPNGRKNHGDVKYTVPDNDMKDQRLSEIFVKVFNAIHDKALSVKIVLELVR